MSSRYISQNILCIYFFAKLVVSILEKVLAELSMMIDFFTDANCKNEELQENAIQNLSNQTAASSFSEGTSASPLFLDNTSEASCKAATSRKPSKCDELMEKLNQSLLRIFTSSKYSFQTEVLL